MEKQGFWSFGHTDEPVASLNTRRLFNDFTDATSKETGGSTFEMTEGPVQRVRLWNHITGGLAAIIKLFGALFNATSDETTNFGAQAPEARTHITGTLTTFARALVLAVSHH